MLLQNRLSVYPEKGGREGRRGLKPGLAIGSGLGVCGLQRPGDGRQPRSTWHVLLQRPLWGSL